MQIYKQECGIVGLFMKMKCVHHRRLPSGLCWWLCLCASVCGANARPGLWNVESVTKICMLFINPIFRLWPNVVHIFDLVGACARQRYRFRLDEWLGFEVQLLCVFSSAVWVELLNVFAWMRNDTSLCGIYIWMHNFWWDRTFVHFFMPDVCVDAYIILC